MSASTMDTWIIDHFWFVIENAAMVNKLSAVNDTRLGDGDGQPVDKLYFQSAVLLSTTASLMDCPILSDGA
jgi:hypothetical protein